MKAIMSCREFGFQWERELVALAVSRGYACRLAGKLRSYDVLLNGKKVQCKRKDYEDPCGGVRVAKGQNKYKAHEYDVLALNFRGRMFFIPSTSLVMPTGTLATKIYLRKFLRYENNWSVFDGKSCEHVEQQRTMFGGES